MSKTETHFCDYCHKEVWGEEVQHFAGLEFCSQTCIENYCQEEAGL